MNSKNVNAVTEQTELVVEPNGECRVTVYQNAGRRIVQDEIRRVDALLPGIQQVVIHDSPRQARYLFADPRNPQNNSVLIVPYDPERRKSGQPPRIITLH